MDPLIIESKTMPTHCQGGGDGQDPFSALRDSRL